MTLTVVEANGQLANINTAEALRDLIRQLDVSAAGDVTVLHGGSNASLEANALKQAETNQTKREIIL